MICALGSRSNGSGCDERVRDRARAADDRACRILLPGYSGALPPVWRMSRVFVMSRMYGLPLISAPRSRANSGIDCPIGQMRPPEWITWIRSCRWGCWKTLSRDAWQEIQARLRPRLRRNCRPQSRNSKGARPHRIHLDVRQLQHRDEAMAMFAGCRGICFRRSVCAHARERLKFSTEPTLRKRWSKLTRIPCRRANGRTFLLSCRRRSFRPSRSGIADGGRRCAGDRKAVRRDVAGDHLGDQAMEAIEVVLVDNRQPHLLRRASWATFRKKTSSQSRRPTQRHSGEKTPLLT